VKKPVIFKSNLPRCIRKADWFLGWNVPPRGEEKGEWLPSFAACLRLLAILYRDGLVYREEG
jgi:hypothetical protein